MNVPILDADGMGRAFPRIIQYLPLMDEKEPTKPAAMASWSGKVIPFDVSTPLEMETAMRSAVMELGGAAAVSLPPLRPNSAFVAGSITRAWQIGDQILAARKAKQDPVAALAGSGGRFLFQGIINDVAHGGGEGGFTAGHADVRGSDGAVRVHFQNENLVVQAKSASGELQKVLATAPDLICVLDRDTARPIFVDELAYGLRVAIVVLPCDKQYHAEAALSKVSPRAFGHDFDPVLLQSN